MSGCSGVACQVCYARNPQYGHSAYHCPGCTARDQLRSTNLALQEALVADPVDQSNEIAQLRAQLAEAEQSRHESQELGMLAIDEASKLRAQLAQRTGEVCNLCHGVLVDAACPGRHADLPDAPKWES
jgi:hypothetical protein